MVDLAPTGWSISAERGAEPTLLVSAWRRKWLVMGLTVLGIGAAYGFVYLQTPTYVAQATLVVQDPRTISFDDTVPNAPSQQYLADQVVILRSPSVAERASEIANAGEGSSQFALEGFLLDAEVTPASGSNSIFITYSATDPVDATLGADALAQAYQEVTREEAREATATALERLDTAIAALDEDLAGIDQSIDDIRGTSDVRETLDEQIQDAIARFAELQEDRVETTDPDELTEIRSELTDISNQLALYQSIRGLQSESSEVAALQQEQEVAIDRRSELEARRTEIELGVDLASSGVVLYSPAFLVSTGETGLVRPLALGLVVGSLAGVGMAYALELRNRTFRGSAEPEAFLEAPLLAEIPDFGDERVKSLLPTATHARSASAEAFRFAAAALDSYAIPKGLRRVAFVSAHSGEGKTVVAANTAVASAQQGNRVLAIDADFGDQVLTRILTGEGRAPYGLTDVAVGGISLHGAVTEVDSDSDLELHLLSRGGSLITAPEFFRSEGAQEFFRNVAESYDVVIVDTPPLLQVAYASIVASYCDAAVVVLQHESPVALIEGVADRLSLIGAAVAGYAYNKAPLRSEMVSSVGSMKDVLGVGDDRSRKSRKRRARRSRAKS